ncbi:MAG TPA: FHA domain-containing protein [Solirubrobacteraceae bacterium]|nr:FHA domain-containing protein [Solirubrobacteraceae bacterium]
MDSVMSGTLAGTGSFRCDDCGYVVSLVAEDRVPDCPSCGGKRFSRASLFGTGVFAGAPPADAADWLDEARRQATESGEYVAFHEGGTLTVIPLTREWTRVGRSLAADVRFDDPTVSRRHALIVRQPDGVRVLDDRSLNGVFVNGERVEWSVLRDGDELVVGRHVLRFIEVAGVEAGAASRTAPAVG